MNKIFKLVLSNNEDDHRIAEELLKLEENKQVRKDIISVYRYCGRRNQNFVTPEFLMSKDHTYYSSIHNSRIFKKEYNKMLTGDYGKCRPPKGRGYPTAIKAIKRLLK